MSFRENEISINWEFEKVSFRENEFSRKWDFEKVRFRESAFSRKWVFEKMRLRENAILRKWDFEKIRSDVIVCCDCGLLSHSEFWILWMWCVVFAVSLLTLWITRCYKQSATPFLLEALRTFAMQLVLVMVLPLQQLDDGDASGRLIELWTTARREANKGIDVDAVTPMVQWPQLQQQRVPQHAQKDILRRVPPQTDLKGDDVSTYDDNTVTHQKCDDKYHHQYRSASSPMTTTMAMTLNVDRDDEVTDIHFMMIRMNDDGHQQHE